MKQSIGTCEGYEMFFEHISYNCPALKLWGYSTDLALTRAIRKTIKARIARQMSARSL